MSLLSLFHKIADDIVSEITTPKSFKDGEEFEKYVQELIFISGYYETLEKTHDYHTNSLSYVKASLNPDFKFRDRYTNKHFYVEAKFRTHVYNDKIVWCNEEQLKRYQTINFKTPVFIIIGLGGKPKYPECLALIPLSKAKYTGLFPSYIEKFLIEPDAPITSKSLWNR